MHGMPVWLKFASCEKNLQFRIWVPLFGYLLHFSYFEAFPLVHTMKTLTTDGTHPHMA